MFPIKLKFLRLSNFEQIVGTGKTERQTDGLGATLSARYTCILQCTGRVNIQATIGRSSTMALLRSSCCRPTAKTMHTILGVFES